MTKIGVFDSGIGGLKVAGLLADQIGGDNIYYIADQASGPYGDKTKEFITRRSEVISKELIKKGVELIVVACNTATASSIEILRNKFNVPFVGVEPDLNFINREKLDGDKKVAILTTPATVMMDKFQLLQKRRDPDNSFSYKVMPNLAQIVESIFDAAVKKNSLDTHAVKDELEKHLRGDFDYLVLGCTHYGLIDLLIEDLTGSKTICPSMAIVKRVMDILGKSIDPSTQKGSTALHFMSTNREDNFNSLEFSWRDYLKKGKFLK